MKLLNAVIAATCLISSASVSTAQKCGPAGKSFGIAGSTTVSPIAKKWADAYNEKCGMNITVEEGGSSDGAARVCAVEGKGKPVEIGDMSRKWNDDEAVPDYSGYKYQCAKGDVTRRVIQVEVAIDGLTVVVAANGTVAACIEEIGGLSVDQLRWIYSNYTQAQLEATKWNAMSLANNDNDDGTHLWSELSAGCPMTEILIAGPDEESGTFVFFDETILMDYKNGETIGQRPGGYFNSSNDDEIVKYVESDENIIGYFGYSYYAEEGAEKLYAAPILNYAGAYVSPTTESVNNGTYTPLSRRLYMNLLDEPESLAHTGPFIEFGMSTEGTELVDSTGYVALSEEDRALMVLRVNDDGIEAPSPAATPSAGPPTKDSPNGASSSPLSHFDLFLSFLCLGVTFCFSV